MNVLPTCTCFDDALDLMHDLIRIDAENERALRLIHGICLAPDGHEYSHAWLEDIERDLVLFVGIIDGQRQNLMGQCSEYYAEVRMQERTPYSWQQALIENRRSGHYGPWIDRYRALCGRTTRKD